MSPRHPNSGLTPYACVPTASRSAAASIRLSTRYPEPEAPRRRHPSPIALEPSAPRERRACQGRVAPSAARDILDSIVCNSNNCPPRIDSWDGILKLCESRQMPEEKTSQQSTVNRVVVAPNVEPKHVPKTPRSSQKPKYRAMAAPRWQASVRVIDQSCVESRSYQSVHGPCSSSRPCRHKRSVSRLR